MKLVKFFSALIFFALVAGGCASIDTAREHFSRQEYAEAKRASRVLAQAGDPEAQLIACMSSVLDKKTKSGEAVYWCEKAASSNGSEGQYYAYLALLKETSVENYGKAFQYLKDAALQGYPDALQSIAQEYFQGKIVKTDIRSALIYAIGYVRNRKNAGDQEGLKAGEKLLGRIAAKASAKDLEAAYKSKVSP